MTDKSPLLSSSSSSSSLNNNNYEEYDEDIEYYPITTSTTRTTTANSTTTTTTSIHTLFLCKFDVKIGNMIEYSCSASDNSSHQKKNKSEEEENVNLRGIEFKALPSGIHKIFNDHVLFQHNGFYGIACIDHKKTDDVTERNSRIRSLGILSRNFHSLFIHFTFLKTFVKQCNNDTVLSDDSKLQLKNYFDQQQLQQQQQVNKNTMIDHEIETFGSLASLLYFFEDGSLMTLWKSMLLGKRILFYSDVPIGVVCSRVHACRKLISLQSNLNEEGSMNHQNNNNKKMEQGIGEFERLIQQQPRYLYYISLNDIADLHRDTSSFCACTTDRIFEIRRRNRQQQQQQQHSQQQDLSDDLCDLFINHQRVHLNNNDFDISQVLQITDSDREHVARMKDVLMSVETREEQERELNQYFINLNHKLIQLLRELCNRGDVDQQQMITLEHLKYIGKDLLLRDEDAHFISALVEEFGGNVDIELPKRKNWFLVCC